MREETSIPDEPDVQTSSTRQGDMMQRLVAYQRHLREGLSPEEAAELAMRTPGTEGAEPTEPALDPAAEIAELTLRVAKLEQTLAHVAEMLSAMRRRFQDMTIAADERLATIEEMLASALEDLPARGGRGSSRS
jgi:hypothetical protein